MAYSTAEACEKKPLAGPEEIEWSIQTCHGNYMKLNFPNEYFLKIIRCVKFYSSYQGMTSINNHLHGDSSEEGVTYFHSHAREAEKGGS